MSSDRPEDLRTRVEELEATVRGLTQELVEANERIRQLEDRLDGDEPGDEAASADRPMPAEDNDEPTGDGSTEDEPDEVEDDIIVA